MAKPFYKLRFDLGEAEITQEVLAKEIGRSQGYVSQRLAGTASWTLEDAYRILDLLGKDDSMLGTYFPRTEKRSLRIGKYAG